MTDSSQSEINNVLLRIFTSGGSHYLSIPDSIRAYLNIEIGDFIIIEFIDFDLNMLCVYRGKGRVIVPKEYVKSQKLIGKYVKVNLKVKKNQPKQIISKRGEKSI